METTDKQDAVDVRLMARLGLLEVGAKGAGRLQSGHPMTTCSTDEGIVIGWRSRTVTVKTCRTAVHLGGSRPWFRCPRDDCKRRVAIVYIAEDQVACRRCQKLGYRAQLESPLARVTRRVDLLRKRLGGLPGNDLTPRPRGMHKRTFSRLSAELDSLTALQTLRLADAFGIKVTGNVIAGMSADGRNDGRI